MAGSGCPVSVVDAAALWLEDEEGCEVLEVVDVVSEPGAEKHELFLIPSKQMQK
jgi:hypothetical protein